MESTPSSEPSRSGRPTSTQAARLTARLRRAAIDAFLEHGYGGTTMEAVAQAAGVTKSTLYARYPDKRTLFVAVSSWALTRQERNERVAEPLPDDLAEALLVLARSILARSVDPDLVRLSRMAIAESARFPEFAASSQAVTWSPRIQVIMDLLRRHHSAGTAVVEDVELAAEQFFAMVGAMPAWLSAYGIHRSPEIEERHLRHAVALFLNGVLARDQATPATVEDRSPVAPHPVDAAEVHPMPGPATLGERRPVGRSGLRVSPLALGASAFGPDVRTAADLIQRYLDAGGNVLDLTGAPDAQLAVAEEICGQALGQRRSEVVLATTLGPGTEREPGGRGNSRRRIRDACEASLRRLRTDYLDLYQLDTDDPTVPLEETVDALDGLVRAGKVLYLGAGNFPAYRLMKALSLSDRWGRARFVSLAGEYHPRARAVEREHFPLLADEGLGFFGTGPAGARSSSDRAGAHVRNSAAQLGCTPAQLALAWLRTRPVTSVVVNAGDAVDLAEAIAGWSMEIPAEIAAQLDRSPA